MNNVRIRAATVAVLLLAFLAIPTDVDARVRARYVPRKTLNNLQRSVVKQVGVKRFRGRDGKMIEAAVVDPMSLRNLRKAYYDAIGVDMAEADRELRQTLDHIQLSAAAKKAKIGRRGWKRVVFGSGVGGLRRFLFGSGIEGMLRVLASELREELGEHVGLATASSAAPYSGAAEQRTRQRVSERLLARGYKLSAEEIDRILIEIAHGFHNEEVLVFANNAEFTPTPEGAALHADGFLGQTTAVGIRYTHGRPEGGTDEKPVHQLNPDVRGITVHYFEPGKTAYTETRPGTPIVNQTEAQTDSGTNQRKQITPFGLRFAQWASIVTGGKSAPGKLVASIGFFWRFARESGFGSFESWNLWTTFKANVSGALAPARLAYAFGTGALPTPDVERQRYWAFPVVVGKATADDTGRRGVLVARREYRSEDAPQHARIGLGYRLVSAAKALVASRLGFRRTYQTDRGRADAEKRAHVTQVLTQYLSPDPALTPLVGDGNTVWDVAEFDAGKITRKKQRAHERDRKAESRLRKRSAGPQEVRGFKVRADPAGTFQGDRAEAAYPHSSSNRGAEIE